MKARMSKTLEFRVDVACEQRRTQKTSKSKQAIIAEVLHEFEEAGDAMRYLERKGRIAWKPTQRMLDRLADAEQDAKDELDEWP
jgi:ribosomal protein S19E (S16A)